MQNTLSQEKDALLALLKKMLSPENYAYVRGLVERGEPLTDAEITRLVESDGQQPLRQDFKLPNNESAGN